MPSEFKNSIELNLSNWEKSLFERIPVSGLISRNPIAYKWKAPWRSWMLREALFWRINDLMTQSYSLYQQKHMLGARILLRSGFETLAILIYLNQLSQKVLDGELSFHDWGKKTSTLLLGSRNNSNLHRSVNIITVLEKCDRRYPGLMELYADMSESAHPNYEGLMRGYSTTRESEYETTFSNRWIELYGARHLDSLELCMQTFHYEYNDVWVKLMEELETWIVDNDHELEASKSSQN